MDLSLIRKKGLWAKCILGFLLTPKTYIFYEPQRAGAPEGKSAQRGSLRRLQKSVLQDTEFPSSPRAGRQPAGWSPGSHSCPLPPSPHAQASTRLHSGTQGTRGHGGCYLAQNAGPSFRGMSQVRLQVTQIATLCKVPMRAAMPRGQHAVAVASAGH